MTESYVPLALKYRPQKFSHLIGQEVPLSVLRNTILAGTVYPSLIFYGHFGSGKTTLARIYAKAVNCPDLLPDGEPCGDCDSCKDIQSGRSMSYMEQDAASCGQVEHIRKIGDLLSFKPLGKYRVICLDEAHAATQAAWNAMLKYVEEPPPNTVFIFVTTEVAKIPDPILSRCFAIPFRGVPPNEVEARLKDIAKAEGIEVESDEVFHAIVRRTGGAVRDALVMLDQARMVCSGKPISMATLVPLGFCDPSVFAQFLEYWKGQQVESMIQLYRQWAPLIGPEAFLRGLEDLLNREILGSVGVEASRSERRAHMRLSMAELWQVIKQIWKVIDQAHLDLGRVEATLICTLLRLESDSATPALPPPPPSAQAVQLEVPLAEVIPSVPVSADEAAAALG